MLQKIITVGNSKALTISKDVINKIGNVEEANVTFEPENKRLIVDFNPQDVVDSVIDPEVYQVAKILLKRYSKAFAELAKK